MKKTLLLLLLLALSTSIFSQQEYIKKAKDYSQRRLYSYCVKEADKAIESDSTNSKYYWIRSKCLIYEKQYDKAIADVNKVISLENPTSAMYKRKGSAHFYKAEHLTDLARYYKPKKSEDDFSDKKEDNTKANFLKTAKDNYKSALLNYEKAIQISPDLEIELKNIIAKAKNKLN